MGSSSQQGKPLDQNHHYALSSSNHTHTLSPQEKYCPSQSLLRGNNTPVRCNQLNKRQKPAPSRLNSSLALTHSRPPHIKTIHHGLGTPGSMAASCQRLLSVRPVFHPVSWYNFFKCGPCRPKQKTPSITMHYHPFAGAPGPPLAFQHVAPSVNNRRDAPNAVNGLLITNVRRTRRDFSAALALRRWHGGALSVSTPRPMSTPMDRERRARGERERSQLVPATKACARARHPLVRLDPLSYTKDGFGRGAHKQAATPSLPLPSGPRPRQATGR